MKNVICTLQIITNPLPRPWIFSTPRIFPSASTWESIPLQHPWIFACGSCKPLLLHVGSDPNSKSSPSSRKKSVSQNWFLFFLRDIGYLYPIFLQTGLLLVYWMSILIQFKVSLSYFRDFVWWRVLGRDRRAQPLNCRLNPLNYQLSLMYISIALVSLTRRVTGTSSWVHSLKRCFLFLTNFRHTFPDRCTFTYSGCLCKRK